ncbi:MAG TPA: hypothetical protein VGD81_08295 [Opitutaceae bacterium]
MTTASWKVALAFTGVFLAGAVAGGIVSLRVAKSLHAKKGSEGFVASQMERFTDALDLTPEQRTKIKPILDSAGDDLRRLRAETAQIFQWMEGGIASELTPEQKEKFDEMQRKQRERWKKMMEAREQRERERAKARLEGVTPPPSPEKGDHRPPPRPEEPKP